MHRKLPQSTVTLVLPSSESYESKRGCNCTPATVLWVPLSYPPLKKSPTETIRIRLIMICCQMVQVHYTSNIKNCIADLFSRRFREGIPFPNFVERSIPEMPLSKLCAVPFALQNRAHFEGKRATRCREKGRKWGGQQRGQKGKKDA